eukprot:scaffold42468_cov19-Tisochrysis_lutea.AAC.1
MDKAASYTSHQNWCSNYKAASKSSLTWASLFHYLTSRECSMPAVTICNLDLEHFLSEHSKLLKS